MIKKILTLDNVPVINRKIGKIDTIEKLKASTIYSIGDVVEVLGFYAKGDGSHHKRVAKAEDDGSGELGQGGIWWCIVHSGEVNVSWFGAKGDGVTDDTVAFKHSSRNFVVDKSIKTNNPIEIKSFTKISGKKNKFEETGGRVYSDFVIEKNFSNYINIESKDPSYQDSGLVSPALYFSNLWSTNNCYPQTFALENITVKGNGVGYGIYAMYGGQCTINKINTFGNEYGIYFRNFWKYAIRDSRFSDKVYLGGGTSCTINNCSFESLEMYSTDYSDVSNCTSDHSKEIPYKFTGIRGIFRNLACEAIGLYNNSRTAFIFSQCNTRLTYPVVFRSTNLSATGAVFSFTGANIITIEKGSYEFGGTGVDGIDIECIGDNNIVTFEDFNFMKGIPNISIKGNNNRVTIKNKQAKLYYVVESNENGVVQTKTCIQTYENVTAKEKVTMNNFAPPTSEHSYTVKEDVVSSSYFVPNTGMSSNVSNVELNLKYPTLNRLVIISDYFEAIAEPNTKVLKFYKTSDYSPLLYSQVKRNILFSVFYKIGTDTVNLVLELDAPYYAYKMQQEGIYEDYVAYRDELHEYENSQIADETMLLPALQEPVIPESVKAFAEKYKLI